MAKSQKSSLKKEGFVSNVIIHNAGRKAQGKGLSTNASTFKWFKRDGEPHPVKFELLEKIRRKDPRVAASIKKTVNMVVGPGFYVTSDKKRVAKNANEFMKRVNFDLFLRTVCNQMLTYGNCFVEKVKVGRKLVKLKILNPSTMYVRMNDKGLVEGYTQRLGDSIKEVEKFKPNEITHFKHNLVRGDEPYGNSLIEPILKSVEYNLNMEHNMSVILERKANAPLVVKVGSDMFPAQDADITAWQDKLQIINETTEWAVNHVTDIDVVDFKSKMLDLKPYDEHFSRNIQAGLMVPTVLLGEGNVPEGLANTQMKDFMLHAKSIQAEMEKYLEQDIFFELTGELINWNWGEFHVDDIYKQLDVFSRVLGNELTPDVRSVIETRILRLLGENELKITREMIKKNEELNRKNQMVGGGNPDNGANRPSQTNRNPAGTEKRTLGRKAKEMLKKFKEDVKRNELL